MRIFWAFLGFVAACDGGMGADYWTEEGECEAPVGGADVGAMAATLFDQSCLLDTFTDLHVVESDADWQALFSCMQDLPQGVDLATQRAAVVTIMCSPTNFRFAAETSDEVVVGVKTGVSGACLGDVIVVPLARSMKPVRLAHCWDQCHGECPPVP